MKQKKTYKTQMLRYMTYIPYCNTYYVLSDSVFHMIKITSLENGMRKLEEEMQQARETFATEKQQLMEELVYCNDWLVSGP